MAVRLGAIYALERISKDSRRDYWTIMETLTAYVRERAPGPRKDITKVLAMMQDSSADERAGESTHAEKLENEDELANIRAARQPATDIQAVLTVLGRREMKARKQDKAAKRYLNLTTTDLRGADLHGAHLEGAYLRDTQLEGADLHGAHLEGANLRGANLERADLRGTHLEGANLWVADLEGACLHGAHLEGSQNLGNLKRAILRDTHLEGVCLEEANLEEADLHGAHLEGANLFIAFLKRAYLAGAHLEGACLHGAHLEGADLYEAHLEGADLSGAVGLAQAQLREAFGDDGTLLPDGRNWRAHWSKGRTNRFDVLHNAWWQL